MDDRHQIRLRSHWKLAVQPVDTEKGFKEFERVELPIDCDQFIERDFRGTLSLSRSFGCPSVDAADVVRLVVLGERPGSAVLNEHSIQIESCSDSGVSYSVDGLLLARNQIQLEFDQSPVADKSLTASRIWPIYL